MIRYLLSLSIIVAASTVLAKDTSAGPSFDCAKAKQADEKAICRSAALSRLDMRMSTLFAEIQSCTPMGGKSVNNDEQYRWLKQRAQCGANRSCLQERYQTRIAGFEPKAAKAREYMRQENCPAPL
jgi:uncharacterized protein